MAFHSLCQIYAVKNRGKITTPSFRTKGMKERSRADQMYCFLKKRKMETIRTRLNKISVIPLSISITYMGAEITRKIAITGNFSLKRMAVRYVNQAAVIPASTLNIFIPGKPNWAKGALKAVKKGFPQ